MMANREAVERIIHAAEPLLAPDDVAAFAGFLAHDEHDPDVCEECRTRPKVDGGLYPDLCAQCGYQAHKEDAADAEKDW